jgi:hypothetical protein
VVLQKFRSAGAAWNEIKEIAMHQKLDIEQVRRNVHNQLRNFLPTRSQAMEVEALFILPTVFLLSLLMIQKVWSRSMKL